ncbi:O-acetylhomoserine aminocarboxypropyltransferase/cysteine synthase family protein [Fibrobacter succinogenes]|uniref:O-acetylhomoserine aminocarboxypropyltransferase/cysteine synthase family protein n=1 Tax=Fibrobacter succinogenes TaxID=833 RepID=UPI001565F654|nr:PLP-dependent transferase [Fibrobacter succinogenes]
MNFNTTLLHKDFGSDRSTGSTLTPIYQASAFSQESAEKLEAVFNNRAPGFAYTRIGNPTTDSFERRIASLEKGIGAVACSSGMAAVTISLLNILQAGDEVIASAGLFGGTIDLFRDLQAFGIKTRFVTEVTAETVRSQLNEKTKAVFTELIGNPKLNVVDLKSVADVAHQGGVPFIVDSTTATPYLVRPFDFGADIVVHSSSKYINGNGSAISGIIVDSGKFKWDFARYKGLEEYKRFGKFAYIAKLRNGIWRNVGCCVAPATSFLNSLGLETLGLRMDRLCSNALQLAEFLQGFEGITVNYPALKQSPYYDLVQSQFGGKGGGILTIDAGSKEKAFKLINNLKYATIATNIGDLRTLVIHPDSTIFTHGTKEQKENAGVFEGTIRVSVGIEDIEDLKEDFEQAIKNIDL